MTDLLHLITPTNLEKEKEKFFASNNYHPVFHYVWQDQPYNPTFSVKLKYPLWEAIKKQNRHEIMETAQELFEVSIDETVLLRAKIDANTKGMMSIGTVSQIVNLFEDAITEFDLDYEVLVSDATGFNIRPRHNDKQIIISRDIHFDYFSMEAEVHHELVHVIRSVNGDYNNIRRSQSYLPTEEGLASWCQDNTNNDNGLAQHAMEYVASSVGLSGSLRDVYDCLCELGMSPELAWKRACRHKFGFVETKLAGDILKPAMYYLNETRIEKLSTYEKVRLFVGKISLNELSKYPAYTGMWDQQKIIQYFKL